MLAPMNTEAKRGGAQPAAVLPAAVSQPGAAGNTISILHAFAPGMPVSVPSQPAAASSVTAATAFARMDSAAAPQVLESTPQRLSIGVRDTALGWVEIRAHAAAGQVSAVLATGSSEAQTVLQSHLPEMRDYLAGQQVRVDQLSSERFSAPGGSGGSSPGQEGRSAGSGDSRRQSDATALPAGMGDAGEESLSYINVRV
jgi:hypothetical protein